MFDGRNIAIRDPAAGLQCLGVSANCFARKAGTF